jgi:hypothetical protein
MLCAHLLHRIEPKLDSNYGEYGYKVIYALMWNMAFTAPSFTKLLLLKVLYSCIFFLM